MARVPVNTDLGAPERVQTVARPMGISAPVATVGYSPAMALAESLAALRPTINGHLEEAKALYREDEANRAYDTIQGMTYEDAQAAVQSGTMRKTESPWFRAAFQKQFGMVHASKRKREIITAYNNEFDKENGNLDEFLSKYAQDDYAQFGDSEFIKAGLREGMAGVFDSIKDTHGTYVDSQLQQRSGENFYTLAGDVVDTTLAEEGDVNAALSAIAGDHGTALGLQPEEMDAQLILLAEKYALAGDLMAVDAVLNADPHGQGSLASRSTFAGKAAGLRESAAAKQGEKNRTANTMTVVDLQDRASKGLLDDKDREQILALRDDQQFSQGEVERMFAAHDDAQNRVVAGAFEDRLKSDAITAATKALTSGQIYTLQDTTVINPYTGAEIAISADEIEKIAVNEQLGALAAKQATPQVMATHMASWGTSAKYSVWEDALSDGYTSISTTLATAGPDGLTKLPEPATAGYAIWRALETQPRLRDRHVTDSNAAALYRDAELLEEHGVMSPEEALLTAARIDRKEGRGNLSTAIDRDKFSAAMADVTDGGWWDGDAANSGDAAIALEGLARVYIDIGIPMDKAIKRASEDVNGTYTPINGVLVNTRDKFIPPNFDVITRVALEDYAAAHPEVDVDEITLWPVEGQDSWVITDQFFRPMPGVRPIHISKLQKNPRAYGMEDANAAITENQ